MKPDFEEGEKVYFEIDQNIKGTGFIRSKTYSALIDVWIIEIEEPNVIDKSTYKWSYIGVPHYLIRKM